MKPKFQPLFSLFAFLAAASAASAHPGHTPADGLASGFAHPLGGWDHLLAMLAVGLWAAQLGGRACWRVPAAFAGIMALSAVAGHFLGAVPGIDQAIAASVLALGLLVAGAVRLPVPAGMALAGSFAIFHGLAHGAEMPATAGGLAYGAGFLAATLLLSAGGVGLGLAGARFARTAPRLIGLGIAAAGVALLAA